MVHLQCPTTSKHQEINAHTVTSHKTFLVYFTRFRVKLAVYCVEEKTSVFIYAVQRHAGLEARVVPALQIIVVPEERLQQKITDYAAGYDHKKICNSHVVYL